MICLQTVGRRPVIRLSAEIENEYLEILKQFDRVFLCSLDLIILKVGLLFCMFLFCVFLIMHSHCILQEHHSATD